MNINLHIERLVLDGLQLDRGQSSHVQAAVEAELTRLLSEQGLSASLQAGAVVPNVQANALQLAPGSTAAQMGIQIAQSVYSGIGNTK